jgi:hypothetical protein
VRSDRGEPRKKGVAVARSFEESDRLDKEYYQSLTPLERLEILGELNRRWPAQSNADRAERVVRVCRVVKIKHTGNTSEQTEETRGEPAT